jgi:hypothetical protein
MSNKKDINLNRRDLSIFEKCFFACALFFRGDKSVSQPPPMNSNRHSYHEINILTISSTLVIQNSGKNTGSAKNACPICTLKNRNHFDIGEILFFTIHEERRKGYE